MQITRAFSFILLAVAAGACSSSSSTSTAPVIDSLDVPSTASVSTIQTTAGAEQAYVVTGTMNFHDNTEKVDSFQVHVSSPANTIQDLDQKFDAPGGPGPLSNGPIQINLALPTSLASGTKLDYQVTITSVSGQVSAAQSESVTLQ